MDASAEHCTLALQMDPDNHIARLLLARIREAQGRLDDATTLYEELRKRRPDDISPLLGLAQAAIRHEDFPRAIELLRRVVELAPEETIPRLQLGMVLLKTGRPNDAIGQLKHAARADVLSPVVHHTLGLAYWSRGARRQAEHQFRTALHLQRSYASAARSLAHLLIQEGKPGEAVAVLEAHLAKNQDNDRVRELLAHALFDTRDYRHALGQFRLTFSLMERNRRDNAELARIANNVGVCHTHLSEWKDAETWYVRAKDLDGSQPQVLRNLARCYLDSKRPDHAFRLLKGFQELHPDDWETAFLMAAVKHGQGDTDSAIDDLRAIVRRDEAGPEVFSYLGMLLTDEAGVPNEAILILQEGYRRFPKDLMVANNLAYALLLGGRLAEARKILEGYPEPSVTDVFLRATWGLLHLREGNLDEGVRGYREAQDMAQRDGRRELGRQARQKMHLEVARFYLGNGDVQTAGKEVALGLGITGRPAFERSLREIQRFLSDGR
jgi:Flp pilus assembly protein TadD